MKYLTMIIAITMALFTMTAMADIGNVDRSASQDAVGTLQGGSIDQYFINIKNQSGVARLIGTGMVLDYTNDDGYSATGTTAFNDVPLCVLAQACAAGALCSCQTYGYTNTLKYSGGTGSAGDKIYSSTVINGYFQNLAQNAYPLQTTFNSWGVFYDANTISGAVEAFLRLR